MWFPVASRSCRRKCHYECDNVDSIIYIFCHLYMSCALLLLFAKPNKMYVEKRILLRNRKIFCCEIYTMDICQTTTDVFLHRSSF